MEGFGGQVRKELITFANAQEKVLQENDHKGGWQDEGLIELLEKLEDEVEELKDAIFFIRDKDKIKKEACDVANFAMMVFDLHNDEVKKEGVEPP